MQTQTFTIDINNKQEIEGTMEKLLFMYKVNKGKQDVIKGNIVTHKEIVKKYNNA